MSDKKQTAQRVG